MTTTPTREQVVQLYNAAVKKRAAIPENEKGPVPIWLFEEGMAVARADLEAKVAELEAEVADIKGATAYRNSLFCRIESERDQLRQQLADSQEREKGLRDALEKCADKFGFYAEHHAAKQDWDKSAANQDMQRICKEALSTPTDYTALREYCAGMVEKLKKHLPSPD